jgi:hypothetical protein
LLCSKGDKDDEQKKKDSGKSAGPVAKSPKAFNNYDCMTITKHDDDYDEYMLEESSDDLPDLESEDDNWDLEQANVLADVLAIARQERVAIAKEDKEAKKKLLKDMKDLKDFYAGNLFAEKAAAEEPEEEPKAAAAGGGSCKSSCWKAKGSSCSCMRRIQHQQRMSLNSSQKRSKALSQLLED